MKSRGRGEVREQIKYYLLVYGPSEKYDIREHLRDAFPDIPFKTYDSIDKHFSGDKSRGYIGMIESGDVVESDIGDKTLFALTDRARNEIYKQMDKDQLSKEVSDWNYHIHMEKMREDTTLRVARSLIELNEKGYSRPFNDLEPIEIKF